MEKKNPSGDQFFRVVILALGMTLLFNYFWGQRPNPQTAPRKAPTLAQAFKGIDSSQGPILEKEAARDEIDQLNKDISENERDAKAMWSKLRIGLIQQYILGNLESKTRKSGILGFGSDVTYFPMYDSIIHNAANDAIEAQALYQTGDLLWRRAIEKSPNGSTEAAAALEALIHKGRGSSQFLDQEIYVTQEVDPKKVPLEGAPPAGFKLVKIRNLHGTLADPNPQGILDRVNQAYSTLALYKLFDSVVKLFGANPGYSYGLAILFFAICTRTALQPLYKKQYDSMKGMALIAPEMKKIQEKYKGNTDQGAQMTQMKEIQALQRRHGVNPLMGCFLGLLQMPIFFVFVYPLIQHYEPKMELVGATFLWIANLSRPDIPLLLLYGLSMFFSFRLSSTPPTDEMQKQQQLIMSFMFPVIFPFFLSTYPSAFTMYWMTYNALSTVFQWRLIKAADPRKTIVKTLMGADLAPVNPDADAVPERPKKKGDKPALVVDVSKNGTAKASNNGMNGSISDGNGVANNGMPKKAAENGTVLKNVSDKKKK